MKRGITALLAATVLCTVAQNDALAQTCLGYASIDATQRGNIGGGIDFADEVTSFTFEGMGGNDRWFGGAGVSWNTVENTDVSSVSFNGRGAGQIAAAANRRLVICPGAEASYEYGPNNVLGTGVDLSALSIFGGVAVGFIGVDSPAVQIVPSVAFLVGGTTLWARDDFGSESVHDTYGIVRAGVGLVLNGSTTIAPTVSFPVGLPGENEPTFGIRFLWAF